MSKIIIMGIDGHSEHLPDLQRCRSAFTTSRFEHFLHNFKGSIQPISPLSTALDNISRELAMGNVAVLASGDPLFFGIGRKLIDYFGRDKVEIHPALSALQLACARFNEPWDEAGIISLHGRDNKNFSSQIIRSAKSIIFTDQAHSPAIIAKALLNDLGKIAEKQEEIQLKIAENLGTDEEKLTIGSPLEITKLHFSEPNIIIIINKIKFSQPAYHLGLAEDKIRHSRGLITKNEVRAATLHRLQLPQSGVFWDLGAGSGSISIEAARLFPDLTIFAVEKKPEEQENIRHNIKRFKLINLNLIPGQAPEAIASLPDPQRVFIGGSGGRLAEIIATTVPRLAKSGSITINSVTTATKETAPALLHAQGLAVTMSTIEVSRSSFPPDDNSNLKFKPITIITGIK